MCACVCIGVFAAFARQFTVWTRTAYTADLARMVTKTINSRFKFTQCLISDFVWGQKRLIFFDISLSRYLHPLWNFKRIMIIKVNFLFNFSNNHSNLEQVHVTGVCCNDLC